jgi:hypothetical protein
MTPADSYQILVAQRKLRPVSPHLKIYQPQIPWILSGLNRITGCVVSGGFYLFGAAYLVSPLFGWHLDSGKSPPSCEVFTVLGVRSMMTDLRQLLWQRGLQLGRR